MKSYFNFTLTGFRLLPIWIAFTFLFLVPYYFLLGEIHALTNVDVPGSYSPALFFVYLSVMLITWFTFIYYFARIVLQSIAFRGAKLRCDYPGWKYIWISAKGIVLTICTLGIYFPWLLRDLHRFFVNGAKYKGINFSFPGQGGTLFWLMTLTIFIPFLLVGIVLFSILGSRIDMQSADFIRLYQLIVMFSLIPNFYLVFRWMFHIRYKQYEIHLSTDFFSATAKIAGEMLMSVITLGIYFPMAYIRIYRYFANHALSNQVEGTIIRFGYESDQRDMFMFMWGQILLVFVSFGFYYPWAFCRLAERFLKGTFIETHSTQN